MKNFGDQVEQGLSSLSVCALMYCCFDASQIDSELKPFVHLANGN